jgi:hypothetical protein
MNVGLKMNFWSYLHTLMEKVKVKGKMIPLHAMEALGVRGAPTHS